MYEIKLRKDVFLPRERLLNDGAAQLSNQELLAILLRTGTKQSSVIEIATKIINNLNNLAEFKELSIQELQQVSGIGQVKAIELKAMIELGKRITQAEYLKEHQILSSERIAKKMMLEFGDKKQEHLVALYLDTQNRVIQQKVVFIGGVRRSIAESREILHYACRTMATSLIIVHNHPSGVPQPSESDISFTEKLHRSCQDLGIILLDHIIVGQRRYYSFREKDRILTNG
ncbi:DNA repair protein RadC [Streptococcus sp. sy018]|uniref:RadC family protein n=1 Tax=Streptococcus sp. sy018 TaxID=2600147 RepID=UPI0011B45C17|nr:DNA repair protein RadC [Streptococcus sp. sy018]TWS95619.1 JAB domain-containing protein [Streptococcus sp. sy018]